MKIHILLPYKDKFDKNLAGSISITLRNTIKYSEFKSDICIYGDVVKDPIYPENFFGIKKPLNPFKSKNYYLAEKMCEKIKNNTPDLNIIEIHNRPYLVEKIKKKLNNTKICLYFHNDPCAMKGSKNLFERKKLLDECDKIFCVSNYIKSKFLSGISKNHEKLAVVYNGVIRKTKFFPQKKKEILYVGKINKDKGVHLYVDAINKLYQDYKDWKFIIIGTLMETKKRDYKFFLTNLKSKIDKIGDQVSFHLSMTNQSVQTKMQRSSIVVIPSIWSEPYGLVVAEAMSSGSAVVASDVGGIPEIVKNNGILINKINSEKIKNNLKKLMDSASMLRLYQKKSWENFDHTGEQASKIIDSYRKKLIK